jgi:hypothetical protein
MQYPLSLTSSVGERNHAPLPPSLRHSSILPHIGQQAILSSNFPPPPSTGPLFLLLHCHRSLPTLQGSTLHIQGWHHPLRNQKSNLPLPHPQGRKLPLPFQIGLALAPPLTTFSHWQPLSVTHQSLLTPGPIQGNPSPLPAPPAANTHRPSLPTGLPWPAPSTGQYQSMMKPKTTPLNGTKCEPTPPSPSPGISPMQTHWGTYAKA